MAVPLTILSYIISYLRTAASASPTAKGVHGDAGLPASSPWMPKTRQGRCGTSPAARYEQQLLQRCAAYVYRARPVIVGAHAGGDYGTEAASRRSGTKDASSCGTGRRSSATPAGHLLASMAVAAVWSGISIDPKDSTRSWRRESGAGHGAEGTRTGPTVQQFVVALDINAKKPRVKWHYSLGQERHP